MRIVNHRQIRRHARSVGHAAVACVALVAGAMALGGCSAGKSAAKVVGFATDTPPPADFVGAARRSDAGYMKIPRDLPARPSQPRKPDDVKALEKSLEATRSSNAAAGAEAQAAGKTPAPTPAKAPPPEPEAAE